MHDCQALLSGKLSLVYTSFIIADLSLDEAFTYVNKLKYLAKKNLTECILSKMIIKGDHPLHHLRML